MKERPILFSGPMVLAILDGRKTQTRRPVKPRHLAPGARTVRRENQTAEEILRSFKCPYGVAGDRLWVRETWQRFSNGAVDPEMEKAARCTADVFYQADESDPRTVPISGRWRPSIHMPRWASRIALEIVGVRVQRVQDITLDDTIAEGIDLDYDDGHIDAFDAAEHAVAGGLSLPCKYPEIYPFVRLWDSIYCRRGFGWQANPWVWVIEFRKVR